ILRTAGSEAALEEDEMVHFEGASLGLRLPRQRRLPVAGTSLPGARQREMRAERSIVGGEANLLKRAVETALEPGGGLEVAAQAEDEDARAPVTRKGVDPERFEPERSGV